MNLFSAAYIAAHHMVHQGFLAGGLGIKFGDKRAVTQNRDAVRQGQHLIEAVRHIEDRSTQRTEIVNVGIEFFSFAIGESCRRLVKNQDTRLGGCGAGNLHQLLLGFGKSAHWHVRINSVVYCMQMFNSFGASGFPVNAQASGVLRTEQNVFIDRKIGYEAHFLRGDAYANLLGIDW